MIEVTKFGHSTLRIDIGKLSILTDPGNYASIPELSGIDLLLLSHEHQDHFDLATIRRFLASNPACEIVTHSSLVAILSEEGIAATRIEDGEAILRKEVAIERVGKDHACIHTDLPSLENCGFLVDGELFYPGDSFVVPRSKVRVLALPVAAPWMRLEECVEYAEKVAPEVVFPIHDGMLRPDRMTATRRIPASLLERVGIRYVDMMDGWKAEF